MKISELNLQVKFPSMKMTDYVFSIIIGSSKNLWYGHQSGYFKHYFIAEYFIYWKKCVVFILK